MTLTWKIKHIESYGANSGFPVYGGKLQGEPSA